MEVNFQLYAKLKEFMDRKGLLKLDCIKYQESIKELVDILNL